MIQLKHSKTKKPLISQRLFQIQILYLLETSAAAASSAALDMAYIAMGRLVGARCDGLKAWDMAAGLLFIREAGGFVVGIKGEANPLFSGGYIAGNADLLPQIRAVLDQAGK